MDDFLKPLIQSFASGGIPGSILLIILWKISPAVKEFQEKIYQGLRELQEAQDRATRGDMLRLVASPHVATEVKELAAGIIKEVEASDKKYQDAKDKHDNPNSRG